MHDFYGYKVVDGNYEIKEDEALVIRLILSYSLKTDMGIRKLLVILYKYPIPEENAKWTFSTVRAIIKTSLIRGITFREKSGPMNGPHDKPNDGSFPMYHVSESHPKS